MEFGLIDHLVAFIILVVFPVLSMRNGKPDEEIVKMLPPKKDLFYTNGWMLIIAASLVLTVWNIQKRSWTTLGIQWPEITNVVILAILALACLYTIDIISTFLQKDKNNEEAKELEYIIPRNWSEYKPYIFLSFAAGFSEEFIYRGFLIQYLLFITTGLPYQTFYAILIPAIAFASGHRYQGWWSMMKIAGIALLLGVIYLSSKSLLLVVIIHVLIDLISGYAGMMYFKKFPIEAPNQNQDSETASNSNL
ncbi:MAG: CPBP family intramembrane metalloprotease [Chitinophagales bacterium]|nr:CPBP family intramembrane metalloprotease [Chitinophagales bacterium]